MAVGMKVVVPSFYVVQASTSRAMNRIAHQPVFCWAKHRHPTSQALQLPRIALQSATENAYVAVRDADVLQFAGVKAPVILGVNRAAISADRGLLVVGADPVGTDGIGRTDRCEDETQ